MVGHFLTVWKKKPYEQWNSFRGDHRRPRAEHAKGFGFQFCFQSVHGDFFRTYHCVLSNTGSLGRIHPHCWHWWFPLPCCYKPESRTSVFVSAINSVSMINPDWAFKHPEESCGSRNETSSGWTCSPHTKKGNQYDHKESSLTRSTSYLFGPVVVNCGGTRVEVAASVVGEVELHRTRRVRQFWEKRNKNMTSLHKSVHMNFRQSQFQGTAAWSEVVKGKTSRIWSKEKQKLGEGWDWVLKMLSFIKCQQTSCTQRKWHPLK